MYNVSQIILNEAVSAGYTTVNRILTLDEGDSNILFLSQGIQEIISLAGTTILTYDPAKPYPGTTFHPTKQIVIYAGKLFLYIYGLPLTGVTPGTDATVWHEITVGQIAHYHQQITDHAVIVEITTEDNWTSGQYSGSYAGMSVHDSHLDAVNNILYTFVNGILIRFAVNNISL